MFIIMLFQIIKYAGFSATSNRPIDDIRGGKNDISARVELILFWHQKYCSVFQNNIFRQIVVVEMSRSHHNLTVVALIGTLLLKASHSRSYWRLVSTDLSSELTHLADRRSLTVSRHRPVKTDNARGWIWVSCPQNTPLHLLSHFSAHLEKREIE